MGLLLPALFVVLKNLNFYLIIDSINTIIILHKKKNCNNLLQFFYETGSSAYSHAHTSCTGHYTVSCSCHSKRTPTTVFLFCPSSPL